MNQLKLISLIYLASLTARDLNLCPGGRHMHGVYWKQSILSRTERATFLNHVLGHYRRGVGFRKRHHPFFRRPRLVCVSFDFTFRPKALMMSLAVCVCVCEGGKNVHNKKPHNETATTCTARRRHSVMSYPISTALSLMSRSRVERKRQTVTKMLRRGAAINGNKTKRSSCSVCIRRWSWQIGS